MKKSIYIIFICLLAATSLMAQKEPIKTNKVILKYGAQTFAPRQDSAMLKWRSNRFGQFIHFGLYAIPGGVWKGKTYNYAAEFLKSSAKIPTSTWDSLMYKFSLPKFNPTEWARMAKQMGVKYMTITTKHHEGFCLWPTKYTDFNISNTPFKRDLLKEIVDAYNKEGIDVNFYYSVLDWHNPYWRYDIKNSADSVAMKNYLQYAYNQLKELALRYPTVKGFWFDGTWDNSVKKNGKWTYEVEKMLKSVRPGIIVNSRLRADDFGSRHRDTNGDLMGDYESGYERRLPTQSDLEKVLKNDWEACMTIPENQWGYHKDWSLSHIKSSDELIEMLVKATSMSGNFLLNFGPSAEGVFRPEEQKIASQIGDWMKLNSMAIYNCGYAGLEKQDWGYFTKNNNSNKYYMIVVNRPVTDKLRVKLEKGEGMSGIKMMGSPNVKLTVEDLNNQEFFIQLPPIKENHAFVIELEISTKDNLKPNTYQKPLT